VKLLVRQGHQVRVLARQASDSSPLRTAGIEIVSGDLRDAVAMNKAVENVECVYHLAAKTTKDALSKKEYYAQNVEGNKNVALAALNAGVKRLVYASSVGVYGTNRNRSVDEKTETRPDSYYRETKLTGEQE